MGLAQQPRQRGGGRHYLQGQTGQEASCQGEGKVGGWWTHCLSKKAKTSQARGCQNQGSEEGEKHQACPPGSTKRWPRPRTPPGCQQASMAKDSLLNSLWKKAQKLWKKKKSRPALLQPPVPPVQSLWQKVTTSSNLWQKVVTRWRFLFLTGLCGGDIFWGVLCGESLLHKNEARLAELKKQLMDAPGNSWAEALKKAGLKAGTPGPRRAWSLWQKAIQEADPPVQSLWKKAHPSFAKRLQLIGGAHWPMMPMRSLILP